METTKSDLSQEMLDLLILKVVAIGSVHGYAIGRRLEEISQGVVQVAEGSLYPALHRLENTGLLSSDWKMTDTGRNAKFYRLTRKGRAKLETGTSGRRFIEGVGLIFTIYKWRSKCGPGILRSLMFLLWLMTGANVQAQSTRETSSSSYLERGNEAMKRGDWDRAIADYDIAIAFNSQAAIAYYSRGLAHRRKGELSEAIEDFNRAIQLNPRDARAYLMRGILNNNSMGIVDEAISDFSHVIELAPRNAQGWNNRGKARGEHGDLAGATLDFDQAIKLEPRNSVIWANRCGVHYLQGATESAIADCDMALKLDVRNAEAWNDRGLAKRKKADLDGALADFDHAIALTPQEAGFYNNRGGAWMLKSDFAQAISDFNLSLKLNPQMGETYCSRGVALMALDNLTGAEDDFRQCRSLGGTPEPSAEKFLLETKERRNRPR